MLNFMGIPECFGILNTDFGHSGNKECDQIYKMLNQFVYIIKVSNSFV